MQNLLNTTYYIEGGGINRAVKHTFLLTEHMQKEPKEQTCRTPNS